MHTDSPYWVVLRVYDGDTIDFKGARGERIRVRVWGLDAPEHGQIGFRAAKERLTQLLKVPGVKLRFVEFDRYGRHVCKVVTGDGLAVEEVLISEGLAFWYKQFCPRELRLMKLQKEAKENARGLWKMPGVIMPWAYRRGRR